MIPIYKGRRRQRGYGVGGNFASFFRSAVPFLKTVGLKAGKEAFRAGNEILEDIEKGEKNWKGILKSHGKRAFRNTIDPFIEQSAKLASGKIKDIFSDDEFIKPSAKRRKTSLPDSGDDIFSE